MLRAVVLIGPPGSGKSTIGEALGRLGLRWREWEPLILDRWGTHEEFLRNKATALPELHDEILSWVAAGPSTAVLESTGLSDAPLLDELDRAGNVLVVRLDVSEDEAQRRVAGRTMGRHLSDDPEANRRVWQAVHEHVAARPVDLVIDTEACAVESAAAEIVGRVTEG